MTDPSGRYPAPTSYWNLAGQEVTDCAFLPEADDPAPPGAPFRDRILTSADGQFPGVSPGLTQVIQRRLVLPVQADRWRNSDLLDNEIRIGLHLVRVFGDGYAYPAELSRLIGYDIDAEQPFVLLAPYQGEPTEQMVRRLELEQEPVFEAGLFRAIRLLEVAGVVHGRIGPTTARWDGDEEIVQITDFGHASLVGEPRHPTGAAPWSAPEQVSGTGAADARDDVWSAAHVVYFVVTGRIARGAAEPQDPSPRGTALRALLGTAFAPTASARPHSMDLLTALKQADPWPTGGETVDPRFAEGQRMFDVKLADKFREERRRVNSQPARRPEPAPAQVPKKRGLLGWIGNTSLLLIALLGSTTARAGQS